MTDMHLGIGMTIDNANARGLGRAFYNGSPVLGAAILPAGTTGTHNGQDVIGVRNINTWPAPAQDNGRDVLGVDVQSGGDPLPASEFGINADHWLATGEQLGSRFDNLVRAAWQIRAQSGATLGTGGWPATIPAGSANVLIELERWRTGDEEPYYGDFYLITDGAVEVEVLRYNISANFTLANTLGPFSLDGTVTKTEQKVTLPSLSARNYIVLRLKNLTSAMTEFAFVHSRYLQDYKDSGGKAHFNRDLVEQFILPLAPQGGRPTYRGMKYFKTNMDHDVFPADAYAYTNFSWHSGFVDAQDILQGRYRITFPSLSDPTVTAGETVSQASSGASATVEEVNIGSRYINVENITGTFDGTGEIIASSFGSLGTPSGTPTAYVPTEHCMPYEAFIEAAEYWQFDPWINISPTITNSEFDALCTRLTSGFASGKLHKVYFGIGNEIFFESGQNSADWFKKKGLAKWGSSTVHGTNQNIGREYKARLDMILYDRMKTNLSTADLAKVVWCAEDHPGVVTSLEAYIEVPVWQTTAAADGETTLCDTWRTPATNPIGNWSFATYFGTGSDGGVSDWTDEVEVEASVRTSLADYTNRIAGSINYIRAVIDTAKSTPTEKKSYEGGLSVYNRPQMDQYADWTYQLYIDAYEGFRNIGSTGTAVYGDISAPAGSNGAWNHGLGMIDGLGDNPRGRAMEYLAALNRQRLTPATGQHNGSAVRGVVLITDGSTTYNGHPVEPINFLSGITGAGGDPTYMREAVYGITESDTLIPPTLYDEGDYLLFYAGVDRGENVNANVWFGEDVNDTSWTKLANVQSGGTQFYTESWLWGKVAGANEPTPTLHLDGTPPVDQHGQGVFIVLKNVDTLDDIATSFLTSTSQTTPWSNINGVTPGADNSIVLVLSTDRIPKQRWVFTSHSLTDRVNGNAGSIGNRSTSYVGYFLPGATSPTGLLSNNWILNYYRPTAIVASFSKS